jgi:hypothetical protein
MSVRLESGTIVLRDVCTVDDVEPLLALLRGNPDCPIDIGDVHHLHAAVLQVLLVYPRELAGSPIDTFLQRWIVPRLAMTRTAAAT